MQAYLNQPKAPCESLSRCAAGNEMKRPSCEVSPCPRQIVSPTASAGRLVGKSSNRSGTRRRKQLQPPRDLRTPEHRHPRQQHRDSRPSWQRPHAVRSRPPPCVAHVCRRQSTVVSPGGAPALACPSRVSHQRPSRCLAWVFVCGLGSLASLCTTIAITRARRHLYFPLRLSTLHQQRHDTTRHGL